MRIGIFGGTFDPPHSGHVCLCKAFLERFDIDKLYVIPTFIPPHKEIKSMTQTAQRFEMTEIAFSNLSDKIVVSDMEIKRQGKSYTALTIKEFKDQGFDDIYFLCGTDMLLTLDSWYMPSYIFENATIVYARRENDEVNDLLILKKIRDYQEKFQAKIEKLDLNVIEISSSQIREEVYDNKESQYLTREIKEYIEKNNLYR